MNTHNQPPAISANINILTELVKSVKDLCFDESMVLSTEGRQLLLYLRIQMGPQRFFINESVIHSLQSPIDPRKTEDAAAALLFVADLMGENYASDRVAKDPVMITRNINLAEYLSEHWDSSRIYFFNNEMRLLPWKEERTTNREKALRVLNNTLSTGSCWLTASALASARVARFADLMRSLPLELCKRVHFADISANKAGIKNAESIPSHELLKKNHATEHNLAGAFVTADELTLLCEVMRYSSPFEKLFILWNDAEEAESLIMNVRGIPQGREILERTYFLELGWHGNLMQLRGLRSQTPELPASLFTTQATSASNTVTAMPQAPDLQTIRSIGPQLGTHVRNMDINELRTIISNDDVKRELAIVYARRWNRPDILNELLADATVLSPYCFDNWFKRSRNSTHDMSQEELLEDNDYYNLLQQVISKSANLSESEEMINKLKHISYNAISAEVRRRAVALINAAVAKGAPME